MAIACLGWGSLIWNPRELPIQRQWFEDGPMIRAEFLRWSKTGAITLVLHDTGTKVRSLWAVMDTNDVAVAQKALAVREGVGKKLDRIGVWNASQPSPDLITDLPEWAAARGISSVIWTALKPKFRDEEGEVPSAEQVLAHLRELRGAERVVAERYIRRTPRQTDTAYRRAIEAEIGWTPIS